MKQSIWVEKAVKKAREIKEAEDKALEERNKKELEAKKARRTIYNEIYKELKEFDRLPLKGGSNIEVINPLASLYEMEVYEINSLGERKSLCLLFVSLDYKIINKAKSPYIEFKDVEEFMDDFISLVAPLLRI